MDAVIAQTCSIVALAMVTVWALVSAEDDKNEPLASPYFKPQNLIACPKDACFTVRCAGVTLADCPPSVGHIDPKGGYCGCCSACIRHLGENERCPITIGVPHTTACGPGLICKEGVCKKNKLCN